MSRNYLRFWGVRGSYPTPFATHMRTGGNTPCVELRLGEHLIIFDAGTGIIALGTEIVAAPAHDHLHIFLSHYHWDHISGLPFFAPAFTTGIAIDVYGPGQTPADLQHHVAQQMKAPYFPVETETWRAQIRYHTPHGEPVRVGPAVISNFVLHHPGLTYGYRVEACGKVIVFAPDNEIFFLNRSIDARRNEFDERERTLLDAMKEEQRGVVIDFMRDADILIHDAQYTPEDYERKRGWGHSCYIDTVNSAVDAGVKQLFFFSYDPHYDDAAVDELHKRTRAIVAQRQSNMVCHKTCEGMIIELDD